MSAAVDSILGPGGEVSRVLGDGFEPRPEQIGLSHAVLASMERGGVLLAEAGTGVGKSFAYLLPAMLRCLAGETVVVATNTIALQQQLIAKDVPLLWSLLEPGGVTVPADADEDAWRDGAIRPVLVKGRGNYVSLRRLKLASQRQDRLFNDAGARRSLHVIEDWAMETQDGTLSSLPPIERPGVWDKVESDSANCMGRKCPNYDACFYQRARRWMERGNLLICNHALFFSDLALRAQGAGFLPEYQHVVLDEAHNVEDVASDHFGVTLSEGRVMHLLSTLYAERSHKGFLPQLSLTSGEGGGGGGGGGSGGLTRAMGLVLEAAEAARGFFESALEHLPRASAFGPSEGASVRLRKPGMLDEGLRDSMRSLALALMGLKEHAGEMDAYELNAYALRAQAVADAADTLREQTLPGCAYWVESGGESGGRTRRVTVGCAPVEVAPLLREHLFSKGFSVSLTSATLSTRSRAPAHREHAEMAFAHAMARLGCDGASGGRIADTLQLGSPFDFASQARLIIDTRAAGDEGAGMSLPDVVLDHLRQTEGGAFVLFTSFASLRAVAKALRGPLDDLGLPLLAQGLDGSREDMLRKFREDRRSVLLGAASFWQGVDVRGDSLRSVIITRLPFEPPDRPLTEARGELIRSRGGNPFMEDALPRAVIRFKQGFGRLIRSRTDTGRVVVLDPRIVRARYGRAFLDALPPGITPEIID
ncbi:MAG: helicase [Phycisphaeraceae bacterium]|nr:MAG: helicase [Phycisphaeraceae bacterium]